MPAPSLRFHVHLAQGGRQQRAQCWQFAHGRRLHHVLVLAQTHARHLQD